MTWTIPNILTVARLLAAPGFALIFVLFARPTADWLALALFVLASATDWLDGYLARRWEQQSRFGAMLDPIADKAMVIIALGIILGLSGLNPWLVAPIAVILFREVFVSGLREFLGADAGKLKVTQMAKWKTTVQMVAITLLLASLALHEEHAWLYHSMTPEDYNALLAQGARASGLWWIVEGAWFVGIAGIVLVWIAALLTAITGLDYFRKALPFLHEETGS